MNTIEKLMTTKEVAEVLKTTKDVVLANAKKCLPNKVIEPYKATFWNQAEITVLIDYMKQHTSNNRSVELNSTLSEIKTELTPALKIKKAFDLMQEGYEEELAILRNKLEEQKADVEFSQTIQADETSCFSMAQVSQELKLPYGNITLFKKLRELKLLKENNTPYQQYADMGLFKVYPKVINNGETTKTILVTLVTQKGVAYINKKLKEVK
jgi:phage antirepressor YoqD-like protein